MKTVLQALIDSLSGFVPSNATVHADESLSYQDGKIDAPVYSASVHAAVVGVPGHGRGMIAFVWRLATPTEVIEQIRAQVAIGMCMASGCARCLAFARERKELQRDLELVGAYAAMAADNRQRVALCTDLGDLDARQREVVRKLARGTEAHNSACAEIIFGALQ